MSLWHLDSSYNPEECLDKPCTRGNASVHYTSSEAAEANRPSWIRATPTSEAKLNLTNGQRQEIQNLKSIIIGARNIKIYVHPQGKVILVHKSGRVQAFKMGVPQKTSASAEKLRNGHGYWKEVPDSLVNDLLS